MMLLAIIVSGLPIRLFRIPWGSPARDLRPILTLAVGLVMFRATAVTDVYDSAALAAVIVGHDALISAFNPGWKDPNLYADQVRGTTSILKAVKSAAVKRVQRYVRSTQCPSIHDT